MLSLAVRPVLAVPKRLRYTLPRPYDLPLTGALDLSGYRTRMPALVRTHPR